MHTRNVDVAIIGAGTAGLNARREVEKAGAKPLMIEAGPYGTTCARVGCMPSKLLIAAADVAHEIGGASRFGIAVGDVGIDGVAVLERVRRERDRFAGFVVESTEALPEAQRLRGYARFVGPTTLEVDDHTRVEAKSVVIASGSTPRVPPPFDALERHVMVNDDVFELRDLPASVAVIGTGIIGLELGQALARLGVRVTLFNPFDRLGPFSDPRLVEVSCAALTSELDIQLRSRVLDASADESGVTIRWLGGDGERRESHFEKVLAAAGREPNLTALEPERAGLPFDDHGRPLWDPRTTQWGDAPVFIAGDASRHIPLLHEAADEGRIAGANAAAWPVVSAHVRRDRTFFKDFPKHGCPGLSRTFPGLSRPLSTGFESWVSRSFPRCSLRGILALSTGAAGHPVFAFQFMNLGWSDPNKTTRTRQPDVLIAAHALAHGFTVVTANAGEFSRAPGLALEN